MDAKLIVVVGPYRDFKRAGFKNSVIAKYISVQEREQVLGMEPDEVLRIGTWDDDMASAYVEAQRRMKNGR